MTPVRSVQCAVSPQPVHALRSDQVIDMEFNICADTRRLFHALTVPEYMETWLCLPGHHLGCSTAAARNRDHYYLEHDCGDRSAVFITGTYEVCRRHNVLFSWRVDGYLTVPETKVDIRLNGNFEKTTLKLRHSGFTGSPDYAWHRALWTASIGRLSRLYEPSDSLDSARL